MTSGYLFHTISWISHKSKPPVKSVRAAEILATTEGKDGSKMVLDAYKQLLNLDIEVKVVSDSKDLSTSLATQRNSINRSICSDVACIIYELQVGCIDEISWIPGTFNLVNVLIKLDSPLSKTLQLAFFYKPSSDGLRVWARNSKLWEELWLKERRVSMWQATLSTVILLQTEQSHAQSVQHGKNTLADAITSFKTSLHNFLCHVI